MIKYFVIKNPKRKIGQNICRLFLTNTGEYIITISNFSLTYHLFAIGCIFGLTFYVVIFLFYADNQSDINGQVNDSADTNLGPPCYRQPASSGHYSEFRTPTAKLCPTKKAIQGKYIQLIPGVVCSLTSHNLCL